MLLKVEIMNLNAKISVWTIHPGFTPESAGHVVFPVNYPAIFISALSSLV
jgi:hypothetical protein